MGVHGLWDLLAPVGRRVSVDTLAGKKLAIDASIWMIQFMKAMRDEKGEMVRNAHLLGFFRRICKLLFLRTKPVFVFDGGTPALKRRTVIARRRHRENAQAKVRKTAEKLLINQLKSRRVEELAKEIKKQRQNVDAIMKDIVPDKVEESSGKTADAVSSEIHVQGFKENPDPKGKQVMTDEDSSSAKVSSGCPDLRSEDHDEMLAASLAAEEDFPSVGPSTTAYGDYGEEESDEDEYEDEEMILPDMKGSLDPTILAALPPSMQLDLLVQMRERLMAENRQKYQQVKKAPSKFSELQIQSYLKTVAFRREIDEVQKAAAGRGVDGVQTSRIASEANREFIFSSSFTGDKQELTASRIEKHKNDLSQGKRNSPSDIIPSLLSSVGTHSSSTTSLGGKTTESSVDVGAYVDEFGRFRISRVRGLGLRMTRDLQRNLDLMKESEQGKEKADADADAYKIEILGNLSDKRHFVEVDESDQDDDMIDEIETTPYSGNKDGSLSTGSLLGDTNAIEISFIDDGSVPGITDGDDIFAKLVAEGPAASAENFHDPSVDLPNEDDEDVEWEDGTCDITENAPFYLNEMEGIASRRDLEEEADIQEAIKRSLNELAEKKPLHNFISDINFPETAEPHDLLKEQIHVSSATTRSVFSRPVESYDPLVDLEVITNVVGSSSLEKENLDLEGKSIRQSPDNSNVASLTTEVVNTKDSYIGSPEVVISNNIEAPSVSHDILGGAECSKHPVLDEDISHNIPFHHNNVSPALTSCNVQDGMPSNSRDSELTPENLVLDSERKFVDLKQPCEDVRTLDEEMDYLDQEREFLGNEHKKHERDAEYVSSEMFAECQELLQMFGLPYIIAPMEAEAQCAFLEMANMVDGVVTEDSDVLLFGARSVFKNIFDDRKYVETYLMKDIETDLGLSREKLVRMALLLGSDYTEGVSGIGIVNAIEVVNAFPEDDGLQMFREWLESPDPAILGKLNLHSKKKSLKGNIEADVPAQGGHIGSPDSSGFRDEKAKDNVSDVKRVFMDKHRNVSKNWHIPPSFPSEAVVAAYISPQVDESTERFSWGKPDLLVLRKLCWEKLGWNVQKADQLLIPVLKEYNKHETQMRLEAFYTFNEKFAKIRSQRIKKAVKGITGKNSSDSVVEDITKKSSSRKRVRGKTAKGQVGRSLSSSTEANDSFQNNELVTDGKQTQTDVPNGQFSQTETVLGSFSQKNSRQTSKRGRSQNPRGRGTATKRSRKEKAISDTNSSRSSDQEEHELENIEQTSVLRKSTRRRNQAKYAELNSDSDEGHDHKNQKAFCSSGEEAVDLTHLGQTNIAPEENHAAEDYLLSGGGFCVEEDEPTDQPLEADTNPTLNTESENGELKFSQPELSLDAEEPQSRSLLHDTGSQEKLKSGSDTNLASEVSFVDTNLRSIPNLRKKRRKT